MGKILYISYEYFELEGIPPYVSLFVPVDFRYEWWIDKTNSQQFRFEKHYTTRTDPVMSGLMVLTTSGDLDLKLKHTEIWDGVADITTKEIYPKNVSFDEWFMKFTSMGRNLVDNTGNLDVSHEYLGITEDHEWGDVHIFQRKEVLEGGSDLYLGLPVIVTDKIHTKDFRWIEMNLTVVHEGKNILHRLWRLSKWVELDFDKVPVDLFEHISLEK